jgi:hypothetical protein
VHSELFGTGVAKNIYSWLKDQVTKMSSGSKSLGTVLVTMLSFSIVVWVLYFVLTNLGTVPTPAVGSKRAVDPYQNAKDILLVVFPLATAAIGFWFGSDGKAKAQDQAAQAQNTAAESQNRAVAADKQRSAVLQSADDGKALLDKARSDFPEAFTS